MSPFQIVLLTAAVTAALIIPFMLWRSRQARRRASQDVVRTMQRIANERTESQTILSSLDVGIIAYGSDDRLLASNPVAIDMFGIIPDTLPAFLDRFGTHNGMRAAFYLGSETIARELSMGERYLRLVCQHHSLGGGRGNFGGHIITVQDFSDVKRQEERRKAFVANVSHELKTPLTTVKSYTETLLDWGINEKDREAIRADIERIYEDSLRMEDLIADLLLLSSLDSSGAPLNAHLLDLALSVRQVSDRLLDQARAKQIEIELFAMTRETAVFADKNAVERILTNLITNAIRYTGEGGRIQVYIGSVVDDIYVKVIDNGIGIAQMELENIFERFYRVDKTGSRQFGGTGLGLPIALELARMHRGRIVAESEMGAGSQFTLFLPGAGHLLKTTLIDLSRKEKPADAITKAAAAAIRDWAKEDEGDGALLDVHALLDIIDEKVDNSVTIIVSN
ncbi:MAG TPA: hypothetical protein GX720_05910 [Clostridiaceae bacterium]|nr:hypothetical protein [Clostridiaceae bacterium]